MSRFANFELSEFVQSDTADRLNIDNTPSFEIVAHLGELVGGFLQPFRTWYGKPVNVTSGYRCPKLNKAVGGVNSSAHTTGWAADIQPNNMSDFDSFVSAILKWVCNSGVKYDQIILERSSTTRWVHIGYRNREGEQRMQIKSLQV